MDQQRLDDIKKRADEASPLPWVCESDGDEAIIYCGLPQAEYGEYGTVLGEYLDTVYDLNDHPVIGESDLVFFAHSKQDVLDLLAEVGRLQTELARAQADSNLWYLALEVALDDMPGCDICGSPLPVAGPCTYMDFGEIPWQGEAVGGVVYSEYEEYF